VFEISDKKSHSHSQGKPINCSLVLKKTNDETGERGTDPADGLEPPYRFRSEEPQWSIP
jgi:hypothetical protein